MPKKYVVVGGIAAIAVASGLLYAIVNTLNNQRSTQQQLDDLKKQMQAQQNPAPAPAASMPVVTPSINIGVSTQDGSVLAKEKAKHDILTEGFRLLNSRTPENAEKAIQIFHEGIDKVDAGNSDFYHGLGRAQLVAKHYPEAIAAFQAGAKISPKDAQIASGMGWAYWDLQDYYQAKQTWERAIALDPKSTDAWSVMSWVYLGLKDQPNAVKGFRVLVDSGSDRRDWTYGLAMARASNFQLDQIRSQFPLPDPQLFLVPASSPPTSRTN